jgi:PAS domain S-box-containing protein
MRRMNTKRFSIRFDPAFILRGVLLVILALVIGFAGYTVLFTPASESVAAIDIASLPAGPRTFSKPLFIYGTETNPPPPAAIVGDEAPKTEKFLRVWINNLPAPESYSGLTIHTRHNLPATAALILRWRSVGHAPDLLIDVMDGSPPHNESSIGENFYAYVPPPLENWTTTTIPFNTLARNSYQPPGAPNDGRFDTHGIRQISITCFPNSTITLDLREARFVWNTDKWHAVLIFSLVALLGLLLLLRTAPRFALTSGNGDLLASGVTSRIVFSLTAGAITLSLAQQGPDFFRYSTLLTYGAFFAFIGLEELVRMELSQTQVWALRYIVLLVIGWSFDFADGVLPLSLLLLASYTPVLQHRSRILFLSVPAIALLGLMAKPLLELHGTFGPGVMFILGSIVIMGQIRLILEHRRAQLETRHTAFLYEDLFNNASDGIYTLNRERRIETVNQGFERLIGRSADELIGRSILDFVHVDDRNGVTSPEQSKTPENARQYDLRFIHQNGEIRAALIRESAIYKNSSLLRYQVIATDITERKQAEERIKQSLKEKEVLLKEIHHRVKNNLQVISSLLNLQSRFIKDQQALEMFKESQSRVKAMSLIHEKLYQSKDLARIDFAEYLRSLAANLFRSYAANPAGVKLHVMVDDVSLGINTAISCGLIVNELLSNALKHAFPTQAGGEVRVALHSRDDGKLTLVVSDNGVGFPPGVDFRTLKSLGLELVNTLTEQLGGTIELCNTSGTTFKISFMEQRTNESGTKTVDVGERLGAG